MAVNPVVSKVPVGWLGVLLGMACAVLGAVLIFRPFSSLSVLLVVVAVGAFVMGLSSFAGARHSSPSWPHVAAGAGWILAGIVVLVWPAMTIGVLAVVVGVALIVGGILDVLGGLRGSVDQRVASMISGLASVIFGVLALNWPSVTLLVVAIVFGFRLILFGLRLAWSSLRDGEGHQDDTSTGPGPLRRVGHAVVAAVSLVVALGLAVVSAQLNAGEPVVDAFYDTPADVPDQPGQLLAAEPFERTIPDTARAWRILYTTTRDDGVPAVASALVVAPTGPGDGPLPVIALAHGTTGVDRTCAPSVLEDPFGAGAFFALDQVIDNGWSLVATDYIGLGTEGGHPYLVGEPAGRSVLDSVRAARQLPDIDLADQTVVWGHSQGGAAALWAGQLASTYAPDAGVIGVAALAPASDAVGLARNLNNVTGGSIFASFMLSGYANAYPDVSLQDYVNPAARESFDEVVGRCLAEPSVLLSAIGSVTLGDKVFSNDLTSGALLARLEQNVPTGPIDAPLLLAQGEADSLVIPTVQADYVAARCAAGQPIDFRTYPALDHVPLVELDSPLIPDLFRWTRDRLKGAEPTPTCGG